MGEVYPLLFEPILQPRIWGARNLEQLLGKNLPAGQRIGESWELVDLPSDESVVANGPAAGTRLHRLVQEWGGDLLGGASLFRDRFPLLIKFLDCAEVLSVQVHPDADAAARLGPDVRPKYEAWYVIHAEPDAVVYCGLREGVTKRQLAGAARDNTVGDLLCRYRARAGDCFYMPAGTVHALGAGLVVAEPQTPSDVTYRLFDWNRRDPATGLPRDLHVEQAIVCARLDLGPGDFFQPPRSLRADGAAATRMVACEAFRIDRFETTAEAETPVPTGQMAVWMFLAGDGRLRTRDGFEVTLGPGQTVLLPAAMADAVLHSVRRCEWLRIAVRAKNGGDEG